MNKFLKKLLLTACAAALLIGIAAAVLTSGIRLSYVADSGSASKNLYLINDDGENIDLLKTDKKGKICDRISVEKIHGDCMKSMGELSVDTTGVYVYCLDKEILTGKVVSEDVYRCDFSSGKLKKAWTLPVSGTEDQNCFSPQVRDGVLTYFSVAVNTEDITMDALLYRMKSGAAEAENIAVVPWDVGIGFTDFFYADNGTVVFTTPESNIYFADDGSGAWHSYLDAPLSELDAVLPEEGEDTEAPVDTQKTEAASEETTAEEASGTENIYEEEKLSGISGTDLFSPQQVAEEQLTEPEKTGNVATEGVPVYEACCIYPELYDYGRSEIVNFTSDGKHALYFMDLSSKDLCKIDTTNGKLEIVKDSLTMVSELNQVSGCDLKNVRFVDDSTFTATVMEGGEGSSLGLCRNGNLTIISKVGEKASAVVFCAGKLFVLLLAAFLLLMLLAYGIFRLFKGKFPIACKVILVCIPIVIVSILALQYAMNYLFEKEMTDAQYRELYLVARQQIEKIGGDTLTDVDTDRPYDSIEYYELRSWMTALPSNVTIWQDGKKKGTELHNFGYFWLYRFNEKAQLVSVCCDQNYMNVPVEYFCGNAMSDLYYKAAEENRTYRTTYLDEGGMSICLIIPVTNEDGEVIGIMETGTTKASLEYKVKQNSKKIVFLNTGILVFLILMLTALMLLVLHPLKRLKNAIFAITNGRLGVQTPAKGSDEIADITRVFNQMSGSIEYKVNELTSLNEGYFKFVPSKMFRLLRKSSVIDVHLGDQVKSDITILNFNTEGFEEIVRPMESGEMFRFINEIYSEIVPIVNQKGGVVDRFDKAGLVAFFTESCDAALSTAVSVNQKINLYNQRRRKEGKRVIRTNGGISYGSVMVGIVGHEERLAATTISEHTNLSGFLHRIAPRYLSRVLLTESAVLQVKDFALQYHSRWIGYLYVSSTDTVEKLYDVFDGDEEEIRLQKQQTKELFEHGVELYCQRKFYDARLVFIEVLKKFRQDEAAKEYLYRCDRYYQMPEQDTIDIYVERF